MKAFVFSLDAFVAFILALVAVYTLIFFSSVPSAYYFILTQAHYLSRDALLSAATTDCSILAQQCEGSVLDEIAKGTANDSITLSPITLSYVKTIGAAIPNQFGYKLEKRAPYESNWTTVYDTSTPTDLKDPHAKTMKKLQVSSSIVNVGYQTKTTSEKKKANPYIYTTCVHSHADNKHVITCGDSELIEPEAENVIQPINATIFRLTVFI